MFAALTALFARAPGSTPADPRAQLGVAQAARARAEQTLKEAEAATQRVAQVIAAAEAAAHDSEKADDVAAEVTRKWALSGAARDLPDSDRQLLDAAEQAGRAARAAIDEVRGAEQAARYALDGADSDAQNAIRTVLLDQAEAHLIAIEAAVAAVADRVNAVRALADPAPRTKTVRRVITRRSCALPSTL